MLKGKKVQTNGEIALKNVTSNFSLKKLKFTSTGVTFDVTKMGLGSQKMREKGRIKAPQTVVF